MWKAKNCTTQIQKYLPIWVLLYQNSENVRALSLTNLEVCEQYQSQRKVEMKNISVNRNKQNTVQITHSTCLPVISKSIQTRGILYSHGGVTTLCWLCFSFFTIEVSALPLTPLSLFCSFFTSEVSALPLTLLSLFCFSFFTNEVSALPLTLLSLLPAPRKYIAAAYSHTF